MGVTGDGRRRPTSAQRLDAVLLQPPFLRTSHPPQTEERRCRRLSQLQPPGSRRATASGGLRFAVLPQGLPSRSCSSSHFVRHTYPSERGKHDAVGGRTAVKIIMVEWSCKKKKKKKSDICLQIRAGLDKTAVPGRAMCFIFSCFFLCRPVDVVCLWCLKEKGHMCSAEIIISTP